VQWNVDYGKLPRFGRDFLANSKIFVASLSVQATKGQAVVAGEWNRQGMMPIRTGQVPA